MGFEDCDLMGILGGLGGMLVVVSKVVRLDVQMLQPGTCFGCCGFGLLYDRPVVYDFYSGGNTFFFPTRGGDR